VSTVGWKVITAAVAQSLATNRRAGAEPHGLADLTLQVVEQVLAGERPT